MDNQDQKDNCEPRKTCPGRYDEARIAHELRLTASGQSYYGNALYVALDIPCITASPEHKTAIQRYLRGTQIATDHIRLQEAAMMIATNTHTHTHLPGSIN